MGNGKSSYYLAEFYTLGKDGKVSSLKVVPVTASTYGSAVVVNNKDYKTEFEKALKLSSRYGKIAADLEGIADESIKREEKTLKLLERLSDACQQEKRNKISASLGLGLSQLEEGQEYNFPNGMKSSVSLSSNGTISPNELSLNVSSPLERNISYEGSISLQVFDNGKAVVKLPTGEELEGTFDGSVVRFNGKASKNFSTGDHSMLGLGGYINLEQLASHGFVMGETLAETSEIGGDQRITSGGVVFTIDKYHAGDSGFSIELGAYAGKEMNGQAYENILNTIGIGALLAYTNGNFRASLAAKAMESLGNGGIGFRSSSKSIEAALSKGPVGIFGRAERKTSNFGYVKEGHTTYSGGFQINPGDLIKKARANIGGRKK